MCLRNPLLLYHIPLNTSAGPTFPINYPIQCLVILLRFLLENTLYLVPKRLLFILNPQRILNKMIFSSPLSSLDDVADGVWDLDWVCGTGVLVWEVTCWANCRSKGVVGSGLVWGWVWGWGGGLGRSMEGKTALLLLVMGSLMLN
jgi:hypothetical protein